MLIPPLLPSLPPSLFQSAFEFANICRKNDYHNFLFSMKVAREGGGEREGGMEVFFCSTWRF